LFAGKKSGKFDNASLVGNGNESTSDGNHILLVACVYIVVGSRGEKSKEEEATN
jgi:hypothetical protein